MLHTNKQFSKVKVRSVEIDKRFSSGAHTQEGDRQWQSLNHKAPEWLHCIQLLSHIFKTHLHTRTDRPQDYKWLTIKEKQRTRRNVWMKENNGESERSKDEEEWKSDEQATTD